MAIEKTININVNSKDAVKGVNEIDKSLNKTAKSQKDLKKATKDSTKALSESKKASQRNAAAFEAINKATGGAVRGVRGLIKQMWLLVANPVGAVVAALVLGLTALFKAFSSTKAGGEKLAQLMSGVSATIDVLRDRVLKVGQALVKFFSGDFKGALESGREAVSGFGEEVSREFKQAADATKSLQEVTDAARGLSVSRAELNKNLIKAKEIIEGGTASYEEKKKAIEEVREAETKQTEDELKNAKKKLAAIVLANSLSDSGTEDLEKEAQARIAVINLEAESSRNKTKFNKLEKLAHTEEMARLKAISDEKKKQDDEKAAQLKKENDEKTKALEKAKADEDKRLGDIEKIQEAYRQKQKDKDAETELEKINLEEERKLAELDRLGAGLEQKQEIIDYYEALRLDNEKKVSQESVRIKLEEKEAKAKIQLAVIGVAEKGIALGKQLAGKNKAVQKALLIAENAAGIAKILVNTGVANAKAVATSPITLGQPWVTLNTISAGLGIAGTIAATSKGLSALGGGSAGSKPNIPKGAGGGGASTGSVPSGGASTPPSFNVVGATETSALSDAVAGQTKEPVKAYVVSNDVTTAQSLDNNIIEGATI